MKLDLFFIVFLLAYCVGRVITQRFEILCGSPPDKPATINYYGDVAAVFAFSRDDINNCMFQTVSLGVFSREVPFNLTDPCGFTKSCDSREVYVIHLETRSLHPLVESDNDEKILAVCNFMPYAEVEVVIQIL